MDLGSSKSKPVVVWANPDKPELQMQQMMQMYPKNLDAYLQAQLKYLPQFEAQYQDLLNKYQPQRQQLQLDMLNQFGQPLQDVMNRLGANTADFNAQAALNLLNKYGLSERQAGQAIDLAALQGDGRKLIQAALEAERAASPEWANLIKQAEAQGINLSNFMNNLQQVRNPLDESGAMSGGERAEIERAVNRANFNSGTLNSGSQIDTIANALTFGEAGRKRQMENRAANQSTAAMLGQGASTLANMAPATKSAIDAYSIGTGRNQQNNYSVTSPTGLNLFTGLGDNAANVGTAGLQTSGDLLGMQSDIFKLYQQLKNTPHIGQQSSSFNFGLWKD